MNAIRWLTMFVAFITWLFCWSLLRDARAVFNGGVLGTTPFWLTLILGIALLLTIGTTITAAIRLPVWPWAAVGSAVFVLASVLGAHFAKLHARASALAALQAQPGSQSLAAVIRDAFRSGPVHVFFFLVAPTLLAVMGILAWRNGPRTLFGEEPHAA